MKKSIFLFLLFCFALTQIKSQDIIYFDYDEAGNCIAKYKTVTLPARTNAKPQTEEEETDETSGTNTDDTDTTDTALYDDVAVVEDVFGEMTIQIFPNPTKGILQIEIQNKNVETFVNYTLTELSGKHVTGGVSTDYPLLLDLSSSPSGVYLLHLKINGKTQTYKIIKQ